MRRSNWRAMFSATSWASSSGVLISWMSILTDLPPAHLGDVLGHLLDFRAFASDDDAGAGGEDGHAQAVPGALDNDLGDRGALELLLDVPADLDVRVQEIRILLRIGVPARTPVPGQCEAVADWIYFLSHEKERIEDERMKETRRSVFGHVLVGTEFGGRRRFRRGLRRPGRRVRPSLRSRPWQALRLRSLSTSERFSSLAAFRLAAAFETLARCGSSISSVSTMRMWLVRLRIALELPRARDFMRRIVGPSPTVASLTTRVSTFSSLLFSALAMALLSVLPTNKADFLVLKRDQVQRRRSRQTLDFARQLTHLEGGHPRAAID